MPNATEDLFTPVHKGLRSMIYALASRLQTNDFADAAATEALVRELETDFAIARSAGCVLCILHHHAEDEELSVFPEVARAGSPVIGSFIEEHHDLTRRELELGRAAHALLDIDDPAGRITAGIALNAAANDLVVRYLAHMNREDAELVPWMREHFTDPQMAAMRAAIIGRLPPDRLFAILGWMLPSLNPTELSGLLAAVRPGLPPPAFRAIVDLCAARVDPARWEAVRLRVGL